MKNEEVEGKIIESANNAIISSIKKTEIIIENKDGDTIEKEKIVTIPDTIEDNKLVKEIRSEKIKKSEKSIESKGKQCQKCNCFVF